MDIKIAQQLKKKGFPQETKEVIFEDKGVFHVVPTKGVLVKGKLPKGVYAYPDEGELKDVINKEFKEIIEKEYPDGKIKTFQKPMYLAKTYMKLKAKSK